MNRPNLLSSLCYLSWFYILACLVFDTMSWIWYREMGDAVEVVGKINLGLGFSDIPLYLFYLPMLLLHIVAAIGVSYLFKQRRRGIWLVSFGLGGVAGAVGIPMIELGKALPGLMIVIVLNFLFLIGFLAFFRSYKRG